MQTLTSLKMLIFAKVCSPFGRYPLSTFVLLGVSACSLDPFNQHERERALVPMSPAASTMTPRAYLRSHPVEQVKQAPISIVGEMSLIDALRLCFPDVHILPADQGLDLTQMLKLSAVAMPAPQFLNYIANLSGLELTLQDNQLIIRSFVTNSWLLGGLSSAKHIQLESNASFNRSLDDAKQAGALSEQTSFDEWQALVDFAQQVLESDQKPGQAKPYVHGVRALGSITAGGSAQAMQRLDDYFTQLQTQSHQQIAIEVQAFDVALNDQRAVGINWQELNLLNTTIDNNLVQLGLQNSNAGAGFVPNAIADEGLWRGQLGIQAERFSAQAVVQLLSRYGEVELLNQPNITVRNGGFAMMHAGEQLSYIAETEVVRDNESDTTAVTAEVSQLKVGVSLAVSAKLLDDKRILLNIWPVVSSVQGFDEFQADPIPIRVPRLSLQELSTEVIVESGHTLQLGGLIRRIVQDRLQTLPFENTLTGRLLKPLFRSQSKQLERRELVLLVKPQLVESRVTVDQYKTVVQREQP